MTSPDSELGASDCSEGLFTALKIIVSLSLALALLIGGAWGDAHLTTRQARGALTGIIVTDSVLLASTAAVAIRRAKYA